MKTRYGAWINLPGISTKEVAQIREVRLDSNSLYLFTVDYNNDKRALEDSMIEIFISAPSKDALRIEARHFSGNRKKMPKFELNIEENPIDVCDRGDSLTVTNGKMRLEIGKNPATFDFYYKDRYLTSFAKKWDRSYISHITKDNDSYMAWESALPILLKTDKALIYGMRMVEPAQRLPTKTFRFIFQARAMVFL